MFHNYIKTAIRRLLRNKSITVINIVGLSLGMAVTFVILVFVFHGLSYDRHHSNKDRIYRVVQENKMVDMTMTHTPYPKAWVLEEEFPEVEKTAKVFLLFDTKVRNDQEYFDESNFFCADNSLFDILTLPLLKGDAEAILNNPNEVVLTDSNIYIRLICYEIFAEFVGK